MPQAHAISICMIVKNEEANLGRCLESVREFADEIVVVDTGSTDETPSVARRSGAILINEPWRDDFSHARNISIDHATSDWVLWLDADDRVPAESGMLLKRLKNEPPNRVFAFVIRNERPGGIGSEFIQARMFPRIPAIRFERRIHEQFMPSALRAGLTLQTQNIVIEHHGYAKPEEVRAKARRNINLLLQECTAAGPDAVMAIEIADAYLLLGEGDDAEKWYRTALQAPAIEAAMPVIASHAHLGLGKQYNDRHEFERALEHFTAALRLCPGRADVLYSMAVANELSGRPDDAIRDLRHILSLHAAPQMVSIDLREATIKAYLRLERILRTQGRTDEVLGLATEAAQRLPHRPEIHAMLGRSFCAGGNLVDALHAFEKSLQILTVGNLDAYIGLCGVYIKAGRRDAAYQTLAAIREAFQNSPRYWALRRLIGDHDSLPNDMNAEDVCKEVESIRKLFGFS
jgi:tetratricopeptide (TPR) repeat protein